MSTPHCGKLAKMIELECLGAARTVTGSMHLVRAGGRAVLLDCGLFQGHRAEAFRRNRELPLDPALVDAVILSHAHIDHSGALPSLVRKGYRGPIYATPATRDLCEVMLADAASIQESDARYINRAIERDHVDMEPVEPLYTAEDVDAVMQRMVAVPYHQATTAAPGVAFTFLDAGHVLGSAGVVLDLDGGGGARRRFAFTGDLGRRHMPILRDPEIPTGVDVLLMESTYGDRLHAPIAEMDDALQAVLAQTHARGGKVVIPSFALERAQEILLALKRLRLAGRLPPMPVFLDSPLAVKITDVFRRHPDCYDAETRALLAGPDSPFDFDGLRYVSTPADSMAIDAATEPLVVISGSGMAEGGRVLHHLRATVEDARNTVAIVGFQAQHTLGRRLVEKRARVKIFGVERDRNCEVVVLNGFSAHADQRDLVEFVREVRAAGPLARVILVHGEPKAQTALGQKLAALGVAVDAPALRERIAL
jgi:metallo-beta-lactamase family protein